MYDAENKMTTICKNCNNREYFGMMHFLSGKTYCRKCIYDIWEKTTGWKRKTTDYVFPAYEDGSIYVDENSKNKWCPKCKKLMRSYTNGWICKCGEIIKLEHSDKYYCAFCDTEIPEGDMVCGKCKEKARCE